MEDPKTFIENSTVPTFEEIMRMEPEIREEFCRRFPDSFKRACEQSKQNSARASGLRQF